MIQSEDSIIILRRVEDVFEYMQDRTLSSLRKVDREER